ncbi:MAG: hypothetical protein V3S33_06060 [Gammaproteobacteria bacterium]
MGEPAVTLTTDALLANPDLLPDDDDALSTLALEGKVEIAPPVKDEDLPKDPPKDPPETAAEGTPPASEAKPEEGKPPEGEPEGVLTDDGRHVIPNSVLKSARARADAAVAESERLQKELDDKNTAAPAPPVEQPPAQPEIDPKEALFQKRHGMPSEEYRDQFGDRMTDQFLVLAEEKIADNERITALETKQEATTLDKDTEAQTAMQEAIDNIPDLAKWQEEEPAKWAAAGTLDEEIQKEPEFKNATFQERFDEVTRRMGGTVPDRTAKPSGEGLSPKTVNDKVDEALKAAEKNQAPTTLSDFPAGNTPADQSEVQALERMSVTDVEGMFDGKTPKEIAEYVATNTELI